MKDKPILVTGATGYVGARLVPKLLQAGYKVRAMARSATKLRGRPWADHKNLKIIAADIFDQNELLQAISGCSAAYYLIHSMNPQNKDFVEADRCAALNFCHVAERGGLQRIIYLGGLGQHQSNLSKHLRSRAEVAQILCSGSVAVTVLRAAMIIGSGSVSFEILRYLVDRLPIMITPRWVRTPSQPIAIRNVLEYLIACLDNEQTIGRVFDIGGSEVLSYQTLMDMYAEEAGLSRRIVIPVPFFTSRLSSLWIHLVTPVPAYIARPLSDGLRNPAICEENSIQSIVPLNLLDCRSAIKLALERIQLQTVESHWTDAGTMPPDEWSITGDPAWAGGTIYKDQRKITISATPEAIWQILIRLGGTGGWYYGTWLWKLRGILDRLIGGVGLNRGRHRAGEILPGDVLDFWRVYAVEVNKRLALIAEMKLPGQATLEFHIHPAGNNRTELEQIASFRPAGLSGITYWKAITPFHDIVFDGMLKGIAHASVQKTISQPNKI